MKNIILILVGVAAFFQVVIAGTNQSFVKQLSIGVSNNSSIFIDSGSGSLELRGDDINEIRVTAKIHSTDYRSKEDLLEAFERKMELSLVEGRSEIILKALSKKSMFSFLNHNIAIDLIVVIPRHFKVEIDDGSGSMTISNINNSIEIDDGSGSITIDNIIGNIFIDDGSGNSNLSHIDGDVTIDDGSGTINIDYVSGDVSIDDGSGAIIINNLQGEFILEGDGSGSIRVNGKKWHEE